MKLPQLLGLALVLLVVLLVWRQTRSSRAAAAEVVDPSLAGKPEWLARVVTGAESRVPPASGSLRIEDGRLAFRPRGVASPWWAATIAGARAGQDGFASTGDVWFDSELTGRIVLRLDAMHGGTASPVSGVGKRARAAATGLLGALADAGVTHEEPTA